MSKSFKHLNSVAEKYIDASVKERVSYILSERFIRHRAVDKLIDHVEYLMRRPPQTRAWGLVVEGEPGSGKTLLAKAIEKNYLPTPATSDAPPSLPVVSISMTGANTARTIHNRILERLGTPIASNLRISEREQLAIRLLGEAGTKLLILDELQDVLRTTPRQRQGTLDAIKLLMNTLYIPVLGLGIHSVSHVFKEDPHLNARFDHQILPPWAIDRSFASFLATLEANIPLENPSNLHQRPLMKLILNLGRSNTSRIVRLVSNAAVFGLLNGDGRITAKNLEAASKNPPPASCLA